MFCSKRVRGIGGVGVLGLALVASACGGSDPTATPNDADAGTPVLTQGPYQPLVVGATWTYRIDDKGIVYDKTSQVVAVEDIGGAKAGVMGYRVRETIKDAVQTTWYEATATDVRRHHDQMTDPSGALTSDEWYEPYVPRVDRPRAHAAERELAVHLREHQDHRRPSGGINSHTDSWHVDGVDVVVAVPAGTFNALKITRTDGVDGSTKTQWFVRGVGKVREQTANGHYEQLTHYQIPTQ